jgi:L-ascorbate metabolism protein UlaG (beta-lactamase superfamily)
MYIYWLGESSFKIKTNTASVIIDPADKKTGLSQSSLDADIVLISHTLKTDLSRVKPTEDAKNPPFVIDSPGEYEHKGVFIYGIQNNDTVLYLIKADSLDIAHLAGLTERLNDKQLELFEGSHIALIPVGGEGLLDAKGAEAVVGELEPQIVIPMNYEIPKLAVSRKPVDAFLAEMGAKDATPETSLSITKAKLPVDKIRVVLLQP